MAASSSAAEQKSQTEIFHAQDDEMVDMGDIIWDNSGGAEGVSPEAADVKAEGVKRPLQKAEGGPDAPKRRRLVVSPNPKSSSAADDPFENSEVVLFSPGQVKKEVKREGEGFDDGKAKLCHGCAREKGVSPCYLTADGIVTWYTGGKGAWCRDCHNVWRTCYQSEHHLALC